MLTEISVASTVKAIDYTEKELLTSRYFSDIKQALTFQNRKPQKSLQQQTREIRR